MYTGCPGDSVAKGWFGLRSYVMAGAEQFRDCIGLGTGSSGRWSLGGAPCMCMPRACAWVALRCTSGLIDIKINVKYFQQTGVD